jgi:hypothetical protein
MATIREMFESKLVSMGMSDSQSKEVMDIAQKDLSELVDDYNITWNTSADSYPQPVYNAMFISIKQTALNWIEKKYTTSLV